MEELIEFLGGAPKSCADCIHSEWIDDPYATGDSPGGWECGAYSCEFSERIADLCSEYDKTERTISEKEDAGEDCSDLYQQLDSADEILNYGFGWA